MRRIEEGKAQIVRERQSQKGNSWRRPKECNRANPVWSDTLRDRTSDAASKEQRAKIEYSAQVKQKRRDIYAPLSVCLRTDPSAHAMKRPCNRRSSVHRGAAPGKACHLWAMIRPREHVGVQELVYFHGPQDPACDQREFITCVSASSFVAHDSGAGNLGKPSGLFAT